MSSRPELSTGEALVGLLEAYGVDTIFGIPGVHNVEMYRALPRSKIKHVLVRHEQGAGFMADGYARATGKPGVCFTITGPGLLNILTPMGQAWSDSSNVLVISTALDIGDAAQGRGRLHEMLDQRAAAATVTSLAMRAYTAQRRPRLHRPRLRQFCLGRGRAPPISKFRSTFCRCPRAMAGRARSLLTKPSPSKTQIAAAAKKLNGAKTPVILLGGGALDAGQAAVQIAEKLGCAILTTTAGKGAVREDHPLCLGYCMGSPQIQKMLQTSDCVLAVGTELSETDFWDTQVVIDKNLIRIDIDPAAIARPHTAEIPILGDARETLEALAPLITAKPAQAKTQTRQGRG